MKTGPAGEDPLHARRGVLRAPRPPPDEDALHSRRCRKDGKIDGGRRARSYIDGGAYSSFGLVTAYYSGQLLTGPTASPTTASTRRACSPTSRRCGPKRGHGSVQPRFAFEVALDMAAEKLAHRPDRGAAPQLHRRERRRRSTARRITSNGFLQCLERGRERRRGWKRALRQARRRARPRRRRLRCTSPAPHYRIYPNEMPQSGIQVKLDRSGRVTVFCGASDIGQGVELRARLHRRRGAGPPPGWKSCCPTSRTPVS